MRGAGAFIIVIYRALSGLEERYCNYFQLSKLVEALVEINVFECTYSC